VSPAHELVVPAHEPDDDQARHDRKRDERDRLERNRQEARQRDAGGRNRSQRRMERSADDDVITAGTRHRRSHEAECIDDAERKRDRQERCQQEVPTREPRQRPEERDADHERRRSRDEVDRHRLPRLHFPHQAGGVANEHSRLGGRGTRARHRTCHCPSSRYPTTNWWPTTRSSPSVTTTPCRRPVLYSDPEFSASVLPMRVSPFDSWMCPCSARSGWYSSISCRTA